MTRQDSRFTRTSSGYLFDKTIFRTAAVIVMVPGLFILFFGGYGLTNFWLHCPSESVSPCLNPCFNNPSSYCSDYLFDEFLPVGFEVGESPHKFIQAYDNWLLAVILVMFASFVVNHFVHNKGKSFGGLD